MHKWLLTVDAEATKVIEQRVGGGASVAHGQHILQHIKSLIIAYVAVHQTTSVGSILETTLNKVIVASHFYWLFST